MTVTKIALMLMQFRTRYPQGSLISELIAIDHGKYIVKVSVTVDGVTLGTALAGADQIETAEDYARDRALATLALESNEEIKTAEQETPKPSVIANASPNKIDKVVEPQSPAISVDLKETENNFLESSSQEKPPTEPFLPKTATTNTNLDLEKELSSGDGDKKKEQKVNSIKTTGDNSLESRAPLSFPGNKSQNLPPEMSPNPELAKQGTDFSSNLFDQPSIAEPTETFSSWEIDASSDEQPKPSMPATLAETTETIEIDFNEIKNKTDVEIKRLGWTKEQGRDFLLKTYGKRSRLHLTDEELLDFLHYLESQPTS
ncbi:hypothetical protein IQ238_16065 [Pleurocapsales cyanobacterium LEGE 06147]|nr:hypothetical protein [Pleurocapsales cyanobacterium LEGE 06147]